MIYTTLIAVVGALALFIFGKVNKANASKAKTEEARADVNAAAANIVAQTMTQQKADSDYIEQKRKELEDANRRGNFNTILNVANELLNVVKETNKR